MTELRALITKHRAEDAAVFRRAAKHIELQAMANPELLKLALYATDLARRIDDEFARTPMTHLERVLAYAAEYSRRASAVEPKVKVVKLLSAPSVDGPDAA